MVSAFVCILVGTTFPADKALTLFDPAVGMGNLLLTALTNLRLAKRSVKALW